MQPKPNLRICSPRAVSKTIIFYYLKGISSFLTPYIFQSTITDYKSMILHNINCYISYCNSIYSILYYRTFQLQLNISINQNLNFMQNEIYNDSVFESNEIIKFFQITSDRHLTLNKVIQNHFCEGLNEENLDDKMKF